MDKKNTGTSPELKVAGSRNEIIRDALLEGKVPMLRFEQDLFEVELLGHRATQIELGKLLGEAMNTTSETWHDNAQADAVTMQSHILVTQASDVIRALKDRFIVPYEQDEKDKVSIGALVTVLIGGYLETIFLTGKQRKITDTIGAVIGRDTQVVNIQSPMGAAIFDQPEGTTASYSVGSRKLTVTIVSIEYPDISSLEE